jgi:hypothetical protein
LAAVLVAQTYFLVVAVVFLDHLAVLAAAELI